MQTRASLNCREDSLVLAGPVLRLAWRNDMRNASKKYRHDCVMLWDYDAVFSKE